MTLYRGRGIVGTAPACYLAQYGRQVILLEQGASLPRKRPVLVRRRGIWRRCYETLILPFCCPRPKHFLQEQGDITAKAAVDKH